MFGYDATIKEEFTIINRICSCITFVILICFSGRVSAEDSFDYGPRFEFGIGGSYSQEYEQPRWSSGNYGLVMLTGAVRLWKGLGVQGGVDFGRGGSPDADSLSYGKDYILNPSKGTYNSTTWIGLRYELPMKVIKQDIMGIHSLYAFGGYCWSDYGVQSTEWIYNNHLYSDQNKTSYRFSKMDGQIAMVAARWRVDAKTVQDAPWLSAYGADIGLKYVRYQEGKPELPGLDKSPSGFRSLQIFFIVFMKFRFFE